MKRLEEWKVGKFPAPILPFFLSCLLARASSLVARDPASGASNYPVPNNFPINPHPLIPAKTIRIAADTIAPSSIGGRVR